VRPPGSSCDYGKRGSGRSLLTHSDSQMVMKWTERNGVVDCRSNKRDNDDTPERKMNMSHKYRHSAFFWIVPLAVVSVVVVVIVTTVIVLRKSPSELFRGYVLDPIPKSVLHLRVHNPWEPRGHRCIFRFDIDKADLELLLGSKQFQEVMNIRYGRGILGWSEDASHGQSMYLYDVDGEPRWFKPDQWGSPKAYVFCEELGRRERFKILIHNKERDQAYFIDYELVY